MFGIKNPLPVTTPTVVWFLPEARHWISCGDILIGSTLSLTEQGNNSWRVGGACPFFYIMATYGAFTSKLEAVNQMLSTIGQSRISTLATAGEANDAQKILEEVDRAVQSEGWHFNKFYKVKFF